MADDTNDLSARRVVEAIVVPVKAKKSGKKAIDKAPIEKVEYASVALAQGALDDVSSAYETERDDLGTIRKTFLDYVVQRFSTLPPVNGAVWDQHLREHMRQRTQDKQKLTYLKSAIIALTNGFSVGEHKALQTFAQEVKPMLVAAGLVEAGKGGRKSRRDTDQVQAHGENGGGEASNVVTLISSQEVSDAKHQARKQAAAILANPHGVPHEYTSRLANLLMVATSSLDRAKALTLMLSEEYPDADRE